MSHQLTGEAKKAANSQSKNRKWTAAPELALPILGL